jgi:hypothetical protein
MKMHCSATRIALVWGLATLVLGLVAPSAHAGLFHRRTVVVETPAVYVVPAPTVYTVPVSTVVTTPAPAAVTGPVVDSAVTATTYVPTVSSTVVAPPVVTTYVPAVTPVPAVVVPAWRPGLLFPRRVYWYGY